MHSPLHTIAMPQPTESNRPKKLRFHACVCVLFGFQMSIPMNCAGAQTIMIWMSLFDFDFNAISNRGYDMIVREESNEKRRPGTRRTENGRTRLRQKTERVKLFYYIFLFLFLSHRLATFEWQSVAYIMKFIYTWYIYIYRDIGLWNIECILVEFTSGSEYKCNALPLRL